MDLLLQYICASTGLYGIVSREKVLEIYLNQNEEKLTPNEFDAYVSKHKVLLKKHAVYLREEYFVHEAIMLFDEFEIELMKKKDKPYFVPAKAELLKYQDSFYVEQSEAYLKLEKFIREKLIPDAEKLLDVALETAFHIRMERPIGQILADYKLMGINFKDEKAVHEFLLLLTDLSNNVRTWSNNGCKACELPHADEQDIAADNHFKLPPHLALIHSEKSEKVGRNDPCPCGSGKKYKKCCLNSD